MGLGVMLDVFWGSYDGAGVCGPGGAVVAVGGVPCVTLGALSWLICCMWDCGLGALKESLLLPLYTGWGQ